MSLFFVLLYLSLLLYIGDKPPGPCPISNDDTARRLAATTWTTSWSWSTECCHLSQKAPCLALRCGYYPLLSPTVGWPAHQHAREVEKAASACCMTLPSVSASDKNLMASFCTNITSMNDNCWFDGYGSPICRFVRWSLGRADLAGEILKIFKNFKDRFHKWGYSWMPIFRHQYACKDLSSIQSFKALPSKGNYGSSMQIVFIHKYGLS